MILVWKNMVPINEIARFDMPLYNVSEVFANTEFKVFENCLNEGGIIQAMNVKNGADKFSENNWINYKIM